MRRLTCVASFLVLAALAAPAAAHIGSHTPGESFHAGLLHPLTGLDHLVAMVAVGVWSALAGGRRLWLWPVAFVAAMIAGGLAGHAGVSLSLAEPIISASLVVLGLAIALLVRAPLGLGAAIVAAFALVHGYAHGAEAGDATWWTYAAGFLLTTAGLHVAGVALGFGLYRIASRIPVRAVGAAVAATGIALLMTR